MKLVAICETKGWAAKIMVDDVQGVAVRRQSDLIGVALDRAGRRTRRSLRAGQRELLDLHRLQRVGQREDADRIRDGVGDVEIATIGDVRAGRTPSQRGSR